ncbi:hypothetical protein Aduo_017706 [Ancylostoma duodenale]
MGHSSASVPDCNWLRSDCSTLNRLSMPWRVLTLLCFAVLLRGAQGFRVKRQFSSPSYHPQQWTFDQVSYQQSYGYQQGYQQAYGHDPNYHNYYQRRDISRHQAPTGWNLNTYNYGYNYPGYGYPYNSYYPQQYSGYPTAPPAQTSGNSYARPPIIREQQIIYANANNMVPSQQQDTYPIPPPNWDKDSRSEYVGMNPAVERTTQINVIYPSIDASSSPPVLAKEPKDGIGNPDKHGIELTKEKDLDSEETFLKTAVEEDIDATINKKLSPGQPSAEELPAEVSSTTLGPIDEKLKSVTDEMTTSDIVNEIMATTPSDATSSESPMFVDTEESSQSSTLIYPEKITQDTATADNQPSPASANGMSTTTSPDVAPTETTEASLDASSQSSRPSYPEEITQDPAVADNQPQSDSTVPLDEFIPTEVPAATAPPDPEPETDTEATAAAESSSSANSDEGETLRAPPLPKQVIEKLKELGRNLLKMF